MNAVASLDGKSLTDFGRFSSSLFRERLWSCTCSENSRTNVAGGLSVTLPSVGADFTRCMSAAWPQVHAKIAIDRKPRISFIRMSPFGLSKLAKREGELGRALKG